MEETTPQARSNCLAKGASVLGASQKYLTYEDLHAVTGISLSTLRRRVKAGQIPYFQPGGSRTRVAFPPDVVERLLKSQGLDLNQCPPVTKTTESPPPLKLRPPGPRPKWQQRA